MTAAGYNVTVNAFPFVHSSLRQLCNRSAPSPATYETGAFTGTGYGDVTAAVTAVDVNLVPPGASTSGCEAADFAGFPAGNIALIQRGTCTFAVKALNAQAAGASAVIIFNKQYARCVKTSSSARLLLIHRNHPGSQAASFGQRCGCSHSPVRRHRMKTRHRLKTLHQYNVIAESKGGDPNNVVMAGAHLDSVQRRTGNQ